MVGEPAKRKFLVTYDTGTGYSWAYLWAGSDDQARREFPGLQVVESPPDRARREELAEMMTFDIENERDVEVLKSLGGRRSSERP